MKHTTTLILLFLFSFLASAQVEGTLDASFLADNSGRKGALGDVYDFVEQSDGKVIVAGQFSEYNQIEHKSLVRINADGSMDVGFNQTNFIVGGTGGSAPLLKAVALQSDGKIIVGGKFLINSGAPNFELLAQDIVRLNADGSRDTSFIPPENVTICGDIEDIAVQPDGKIIVVGNITFCLGSTIDNNENILRLNVDGTIDQTFQVSANGFNVEQVRLQSDNKIIIAGIFSDVNGQPREGIARLNSDGTLDSTFDIGTGFDDDVNDIALQADGKVVAVGDFETYNGSAQKRIVRLNTDGTVDTSFDSGDSSERFFPSSNASFGRDIETVSIQPDGKIIIGGNFNRYDGGVASKITRLNVDGSLDANFNNIDDLGVSTGAVFSSLVKTDGKILAGGAFQYLDQRRMSRISQLNSDGTTDENFNPTFGPSEGYNSTFVNKIEPTSDNGYLITGQFSEYDDKFSRNIAKINSDGTRDSSFNVGSDIFNGFDDDVNDFLVQPDGKVVVVGKFENYNQTPSGGIIRLNVDGTVDNTFNPGTGVETDGSANIRTIHRMPNGKFLIGGFFASFNGNSVFGFARLNSDGSFDNSFNIGSGVSNPVDKIFAVGSNQYLISGPNSYNGVSISSRLYRIDADGLLDTSFNVTAYSSGSVEDVKRLSNGQLYIGGFFSTGVGSITRPILRLNNDGTLDTNFNTTGIMQSTNTGGEVNAIEVQADGKVIIGGRFREIEGRTIRGLVRLNDDGSFDDTFNPEVPTADIETYEGLNDDGLAEVRDLFLEDSGRLLVTGNFGTYNNEAKMPLLAVFADAPATLSVQSFSFLDDAVRVYPNPSNDQFKISSSSLIHGIEVFDILGKMVFKYRDINSQKFTVTTERYKKGLYLLKISTHDGVVTKKQLIN